MQLENLIHVLDWDRMGAALDEDGFALTPPLLCAEACAELRAAYASAGLFRSRVVMARHGFGQGEYQYFSYPLPPVVSALRSLLYPRLAGIANRWQERLGATLRYPPTHEAFLASCRASGQARPTPLLLRYAAGDYNCLHQDLYGETVFPLQLVILLSRPGEDFQGGEFVLTHQRPRRQSRVDVVGLSQGQGLIFAVNERPGQGVASVYRVKMRHGVSRVQSGQRYTLGIIFHDAA